MSVTTVPNLGCHYAGPDGLISDSQCDTDACIQMDFTPHAKEISYIRCCPSDQDCRIDPSWLGKYGKNATVL